jgi:hypothetical protein
LIFFNALLGDPARASTLLLTGLMVIGLGFFIRASTKDRIETAQFGSRQTAEALQQAVVKYFYSRAYRPPESPESSAPSTDLSQLGEPITLVGMVSSSLFLAIFLSLLAAVGFVCLALIMATLFPSWGNSLLLLTLAAPLAGRFYWQKSSRPETLVFKVEPLQSESEATVSEAAAEKVKADGLLSKLTVKGHRDEIAEFQSVFTQAVLKDWAGLKKWED